MNRSYSKRDSFSSGIFMGRLLPAYQIEGAWNEGAKRTFDLGYPILKLSAAPLKKQEKFAIDRS